MPSSINVINVQGEKEPFSLKKVYRSVLRSGGSKELAHKISKEIESKVYSDISTKEIFKNIKNSLKKENLEIAIKFSLKESIRKLGPTGFIFEKYVGNLFNQNGYIDKTNRWLNGKCIDYEIDVFLEKNNIVWVGECKYRNKPGERIDVGVCLKSFATFLDIKNGKDLKKESKIIIITNAKFTTKAIKYSNCQGIELLGWNYPENEGLQYLIESKNLYPITILPSFNQNLINNFFVNNVMTVKDVLSLDIEKFPQKINISKVQLEKLKKEAQILCR
jgi:hypothetical protein